LQSTILFCRMEPTPKGVAKGQKLKNDKTMEEWWNACQRYEFEKKKKTDLSYGMFLASAISGNKFENTHSMRNSFGNYYKKYRAGTLERTSVKRQCVREFVSIEKKLCEYLDARTRKHQRHKLGVTRVLLKEECLKWYRQDPELSQKPFSCSDGWLNNALHRHGYAGSRGEGSEITDEENAKMIAPWLKDIWDIVPEDEFKESEEDLENEAGAETNKNKKRKRTAKALVKKNHVNESNGKATGSDKVPSKRGNCRFFLDTASPKEWNELLPLGIFHGVTTNPVLLERANQPCTIPHLHQLASQVLLETNEFMAQTWGSNSQELYENGMALSLPDRDRIVVTVPVTSVGTAAASMLIRSGVRVCLTACYASHQALVASGVGAEYLAPDLGRMADAGKDGMAECAQMNRIGKGLKSDTRILVASIRDVKSFEHLAAQGLDTFTFSPEICRSLFVEKLTDDAAVDFEDAARRGVR